MTIEREIDPARQAELAINSILADLEAKTGRIVESLSLHNVDVTRLDSTGRELLSGARIGLQRNPGLRSWERLP